MARGPIEVEAMRVLQVHQIFAVNVRRRLLFKEIPIGFEMPLMDKQRIVRGRMLVETFRQNNDRTEVHRTSPESGEELALHADVFDVLGVARRGDGRVLCVERNANGSGGLRIEVDAHWSIEQIAGLFVPMLPFAHVRRKLDGVAVGPVKSLVDVQDRLDVVIAGGEVREILDGITEGRRVDDPRSVGLPIVDIQPEKLGAGGFFLAELKPRLGILRGGNAQEDVPVERFAIGSSGRKRNFEAKFCGLGKKREGQE